MFPTKSVTAPAELKADDQGSVSAVFSTFDVVDGQGDIVDRSAFTDGQSVPMVWAHDWSRIIGKGTVRTDPKRAIFDGRFFLDTTEGADAYRTVKAMGDLQEYSWGFQILDAAEEVRDGMPIRVIKKAEVFEVSPVLIGANRETYTLAIKGRRRLSRGQLEAVITTLQALLGDDEAEDLAEAAIDAASDDGKAADPVALLKAYADGLKGAPDEALLEARAPLVELLSALGGVRGDLEALAKRADLIGSENPRELFRQFQRLSGLYGPTPAGRVAV